MSRVVRCYKCNFPSGNARLGISLVLLGCSAETAGVEEPVDEPQVCAGRNMTALLSDTWTWDRVVRHTFSDGEPSEIEAQDLTDSDFEIEFTEEGRFVIRNDGTSLEGDWEFINDAFDFTMTFDDSELGSSDVQIIRLTDNELWTHTVADLGDGTVVETEAKHSGTGADVDAPDGVCDDREAVDLFSQNWEWDRVIRRYYDDGEPASIEAQDLTDSDFEIEFSEDGRFVIRNDGTSVEGDWSFGEDSSDFTMSFDGMDQDSSDVHIIRLTDDELWTLTIVDLDDGTTVETEARHTKK